MKNTRERLGITTTDLAEIIGMSQAQISRLENGKQGFRSATLHKIADALKVKAVFLINGDQKTSPASVVRDASFYGPGMPSEVIEALNSEKYRAFLMKSVKIFINDEATFSQLSAMVRKYKLKHLP
jgi:transcriptional regulator with XRE-family HTH domain